MSATTSIISSNISSFTANVGKSIAGCNSLEEAAQKVTDSVYTQFKSSVVLARLFATVPFEMLPPSSREFVKNLAAGKGLTSKLTDHSSILTLLGTSGVEKQWNSRLASQGHIGFPLVSADFIDQIPMVSQLLKSLGFPLDWLSGNGTGIMRDTMGKLAGIFYVPDAKTAVDERGRKIITAQDFVEKYGVRTVFGTGGGYIQDATFIVLIVFTRENIDQERAQCFMPLATVIKAETTGLLSRKKIFNSNSK